MNKQFTPVQTPSTNRNEWHAFLRLNFAKTARGVRLIEKAHQGPLYVQKPFYPEGLDLAHVYLLHPPGGLVSGDRLEITVNSAEQANVLVTTPGAARMYRARSDGKTQQQDVNINVAPQGCVEWLPLETIVFPNANAASHINIDLAKTGRFIYWDTLCLGLPASNQHFDSGQYNQCLKISIAGQLQLQERLVINDQSRKNIESIVGLQGNANQGLFVAGTFSKEPHELITSLQDVCRDSSLLAAVTYINGFVVVRTLADCSEKSRLLLEKVWGKVRLELLDRKACAPRIWKT